MELRNDFSSQMNCKMEENCSYLSVAFYSQSEHPPLQTAVLDIYREQINEFS
jgi:hypothetical protein